jgi:hypothetical protein
VTPEKQRSGLDVAAISPADTASSLRHAGVIVILSVVAAIEPVVRAALTFRNRYGAQLSWFEGFDDRRRFLTARIHTRKVFKNLAQDLCYCGFLQVPR